MKTVAVWCRACTCWHQVFPSNLSACPPDVAPEPPCRCGHEYGEHDVGGCHTKGCPCMGYQSWMTDTRIAFSKKGRALAAAMARFRAARAREDGRA
jgi:hypothetical protein